MKLSKQASEEQESIGLKHRNRKALGRQMPARHDLMKQRARLLRLREDFAKEIQRLRCEACEETPKYSMHMADAATDSFDRDVVLGLVSFEQEGLYEIDAALKRIEDGTYGICELTGKPIAWERLEAIPWTRFSIEAENQIEGNVHPHVGPLGSVRMAETELSRETSDGLADEEVDSLVDLDLPLTRLEIRFSSSDRKR